jgi:glycosyl transferase family 87
MKLPIELRPTRLLVQLRWLAWGCVAFALIFFCWRTVIPATRFNTYAFSVYYTSARLTLQGQGGAHFCDPWFFDQQYQLGLRADVFCPFPPTMALLMLPVAWMPPIVARVAWIVLDVAMVVAIVAIAWRLIGRVTPAVTARTESGIPAVAYLAPALAVVALYQPLHADLQANQVYTLIALLYALWLYGHATRRDWLCGAAMAGLALAKLSGWPLWVFALVSRRWRVLAWAIGLGLSVMLATLPLLGADFWELYLLRQLATVPNNPVNGSPAFQTITSLLRQCFVYDANWSSAPLVDAPWLATALWWLLAALLLWATLRRAAADWTLFSGMALCCLIVPLQPAGEQYHYTLLLTVVLILLGGWMYGRIAIDSYRAPIVACLSLAGLLFVAPSYFLRPPWLTGGWPLAPLAYPRLYGALLLWGALLMMRDTGVSARRPAVAPEVVPLIANSR